MRKWFAGWLFYFGYRCIDWSLRMLGAVGATMTVNFSEAGVSHLNPPDRPN